jgi:hypothetical protein
MKDKNLREEGPSLGAAREGMLLCSNTLTSFESVKTTENPG